MILKSYIFCDGSDGYRQYPKDHSEKFLKSFCTESKSQHQIAVHRDGNLMYYAYSYRKTEQELLGLCVVTGELCLKPQVLFEFFQEIVNDVARKGVLFQFDDDGSVKLNTYDFISEKGEVEELFRNIKAGLDKKRFWEELPSEDYSIALDARVVFAFKEEEQSKIVDAIRHYHNVYITLENPVPTSFSMTVMRLNAEKKQLQIESENLNKEIIELSRQKKQYKTVVLLAAVLLIGTIITAIIISNKNTDIENKANEIELLYDTKHGLESEIDHLESNINQLNNDIDTLNNRISELQVSYEFEHSRYEEVLSDFDTFQSIITNRQPFFITKTSFDFRSGYLDVTYFGLKEGECSIIINVYKENGNRVSTKSFSGFYYYEGPNRKQFYITSSLDGGLWYYFEVCIDKVIVGGQMH